MKLLFAPTSPFVRKVMVCAHLSGMTDQIEKLDSAAHPIRRDERIGAYNPLAKVPTLVLDDGEALYDSRVICEYIAHAGNSNDLFPAAGPARWRALQQQAMADGLLDAALLARYEHTARPAELQMPEMRAAYLIKVRTCLERIESVVPQLGMLRPSIGDVTIGSALGYLDFRFPELNWRAHCPQTATWFALFNAMPAMQLTQPFEQPHP